MERLVSTIWIVRRFGKNLRPSPSNFEFTYACVLAQSSFCTGCSEPSCCNQDRASRQSWIPNSSFPERAEPGDTAGELCDSCSGFSPSRRFLVGGDAEVGGCFYLKACKILNSSKVGSINNVTRAPIHARDSPDYASYAQGEPFAECLIFAGLNQCRPWYTSMNITSSTAFVFGHFYPIYFLWLFSGHKNWQCTGQSFWGG